MADHPEDDPHGDLDYDEDSITNSPLHANIDSVSEGKELDQTNQLKITAAYSNGNSTDTDAQKKGLLSVTDNHAQNDRSETDEDDQQAVDGGKRSNRIRSFINFNHNSHDDIEDSLDNPKKLAEHSTKDRSHKSYESLLKYFFKDACYFQIKSVNHENVDISMSLGVWSTPIQNEMRLNAAFREHRNVILIFSVQQSGAFQGFARMISEASPANRPVAWVLPPRLSNTPLGNTLRLEWLCSRELSFAETSDLYNPFNSNKPIKVARDGQQVEPKVGKRLCSLFPRDSKKRLLACVETLKKQTRQRKQMIAIYDNNYDPRAYSAAMRDRYDPYIMPHLVMTNGLDPAGEPSPIHSAHNHNQHLYPPHPPHFTADFRGPIRAGLRRGPDFGPEPYHRQAMYPGHFMGPAHQRNNPHAHQMRDFDVGFIPNHHHPQVMVPHVELQPAPETGPSYAQARPHSSWESNMDPPGRYHPYSRPRRRQVK